VDKAGFNHDSIINYYSVDSFTFIWWISLGNPDIEDIGHINERNSKKVI